MKNLIISIKNKRWLIAMVVKNKRNIVDGKNLSQH
jgi:hypothetical protein